MSRKKATLISSAIALCGGILCALSFGPLADLKIFNLTIFDLFDYLSSNICLPIGGMICSVFTGWIMERHILNQQLTNNGTHTFPLFRILIFFLKWILPVAILLIFMNSIGFV